MDCIFCKIINREIPSEIIFEDEHVIVILDAFPESKGHTLIIPKKHVENILEVPETIEVTNYIQKIVPILRDKYGFTDFKIIMNNGQAAGQVVFHQHTHIVPFY